MDLTGQSTADMLAIELKNLINSGHIRDGERLVERELANQFSVSRIPMREAIRLLERDGFVEVFRNRGAVVKTLSIEDIDEIYSLRALLEGDAIYQSVTHLSVETLARAELTHNLLATTTEYEKQGRLNGEFHDLLYSGCKNQRLLMMINHLRNQIERYEYLQQQLLAETPLFQEDHRAILIACQEKQSDKARQEVMRHIHVAGQMLKRVISQRQGA